MTRLLVLISFALVILAVPAFADDQAFGGVGLQVVPTVDGTLVVLNVLEGSPASVKGMSPGDLIFRVGDYELAGSDFGKVVSEHLWGAAGSVVTLHFRRPGMPGDRMTEIERSYIDPRLTVTPSVQGGAVEQEVGKK